MDAMDKPKWREPPLTSPRVNVHFVALESSGAHFLRCSPTAFFTSSTVSRCISGSSSESSCTAPSVFPGLIRQFEWRPEA